MTTEESDMSNEVKIPAIPDPEQPDPERKPEPESPAWSTNTKIIVTVGSLILLVALTMRFTNIIRIITLAAIIAYLMNPIIAFVHKRTKIRRGVAVALVYVLAVLVLVTAVTILGAATYIQATSFIEQFPVLITEITAYAEIISTRSEPITIGTFAFSPAEINWNAIGQQVLGLVEPAAGKSYQLITSVATKTVGIVGDLFFIFVLSIYLAAEIPKLGGYVMRVARTPGYQHDASRLMKSFSQVWSSYLRGQMLLGLSVGTASWFGLTVLGVQNSIALGIISGILEFVPNIGPVIGAIIAITVAFFQTTPNNWGLTSVQLTLLVLAWMFIVQQLENNILVPRIMGNALDLHPLLVLLGVLMGASLAGVLGAILAAPLLATIKLISLYVWRKMFDLPPFETELAPVVPRAPKPPLKERWRTWRSGKKNSA